MVSANNFIPLVHVLMPVYNHGSYLKQSIVSVLEQDHANLCLLVMNDGSTEDVGEILSEFSSDPRVNIYHQENQGLPQTLTNLYLLSLTQAQKPMFITWHSADNFYEPDAISTMVDFLCSNYNLAVTFGNVRLVDENNDPIYFSDYRKDDQLTIDSSILNLSYPFDSLASFNDNFINACFLTRADFEARLSTFKNSARGFEDYVRWLELSLISKGQHVGISRPLYNYRLHKDSLTSELKTSENLPKKQLLAVRKAAALKEDIRNERLEFSLKPHSRFPAGRKQKVKTTHQLKQVLRLKAQEKNPFTLNIQPLNPILKTSASSILTPFEKASHSGHQRLFLIPPLSIRPDNRDNDTLEWIFPGVINTPLELTRARNRNLKMFDEEKGYLTKNIIFCPAELVSGELECLSNLVRKNSEHLFVLYSSTVEERAVADNIYLKSSCATNFRIVFENRDQDETRIGNINLLNTLGSIDSILSRSLWVDLTNEHSSLYVDYIAESILSTLVKRNYLVNNSFLDQNKILLPLSPLISGIERNSILSRGLDRLSKFRSEEISDQRLDSYSAQFESVNAFPQLITACLASLI